MKFLFGKKKNAVEKASSEKSNLPEAIMKNKDAINILEKRQLHLEKRIHDLNEEAKEKLRKQDKQGAMLALKRKKLIENEMVQLGNARLTLEMQINTLESQQTQQMAVMALSHGVTAQKQIAGSLNIQSIDKLMDDLQEQQDRQMDVANVLAQGQPVLNEEELLEELQGLDLEAKLTVTNVPPVAVGSATPIPQLAAVHQEDVNTSPVKSTSAAKKYAKDDEEEQLRRLEAELAL